MGVRGSSSMAREGSRGSSSSVSDRVGASKRSGGHRQRGIVIGKLRIGTAEIILAAIGVAVAWGLYQKQNADALVAQCAQRHERGDYEGAMALCNKALSTYISLNEFTRVFNWRQGIFWPDVAQTTDNMGVVHMNLGNNAAALHYHQAALSLREQHLGPDSLDVAATLDNLGLVYRQVSDLEKALEYHNRALDIRRKSVGEMDLATAASLTAIANIHYQKEEYSKALGLYDEVLKTQQQLLGNDHLDVAATLQNIGTVLKHSDLEGSWEHLETSLAIIVGIYGHNHRAVADTLNNMGGVRYAQQRWEAALETYQQALDIALSVLGDKHPDYAATLSNIAGVLQHLDRDSEAQEKFAQAAAIWKLSGIEWKDEMRQYLPLNFEGGG